MSEQLDQQLSALIDDVLASDEKRSIEQRLAQEPGVAAKFEGMKRANSLARDYFESELNEPVPLALARAIENADSDKPRVPVIAERKPDIGGMERWMPTIRALAASLALIVGGAAAGYMAATWPSESLVAKSGWLADVADYHRVYAAEERHLVEVPASDKEHLEKWLTKVVGVPVIAPDLTKEGLTFEGGRLLVAGSQPVAQLLYRYADGSVVALCTIKTDKLGDGSFAEATLGTTRMVSWKNEGSAFVVVGELADEKLKDIAKAAAPLI